MNALDNYFRYVRKDSVYYNYTNIISDYKEYEKISRKKQIFGFYNSHSDIPTIRFRYKIHLWRQ